MSKIVIILLAIVAGIAAIYLIFKPKQTPATAEELPPPVLNSTAVSLAGGAQNNSALPETTGNTSTLTTPARSVDPVPYVDPAAFDLAHNVTSYDKMISGKEYNESISGQTVIPVSYGYAPGMYGKVPQFMTDLYTFVQNVGWVKTGSGYYGV